MDLLPASQAGAYVFWKMFELWDLSDALCAFSNISVRSEMDSPARSVRWCQTLCEYIVWALMLLFRQKSGSKIPQTKWFYFGAAIKNADSSIYTH